MASIGSRLDNAESGWKRIDSLDKNIKYFGTWTDWADVNRYFYGGSIRQTNVKNSYFTFLFFGSKLRLLSLGGGTTSNYPGSVKLQIDSNSTTFSCKYGTTGGSNFGSYLVYNNTALSNDVHKAIITLNETNVTFSIDSIDISSTGYLIPFTKFLIQDGDNIKYTVDGNDLITTTSTPFTKELFDSKGMNDLSLIIPILVNKFENSKYNIGILLNNYNK